MDFIDARRLTGPNLLWDRPGSILDVRCAADEAAEITERWSALVRRMLDAVGWGGEALCSRPLSGGVSLAFSAPIDALYAATEINEWAWSVLERNGDLPGTDEFEAAAATLKAAIADEANPPLLKLREAAQARDVAFLWDDDEVSVGLGAGSETWPFRELPSPGDLDWARYHDIPVGVVTGTNGKTTTVRLATHIARIAGRKTGVSCTDWIAVDDEIIDRGDWSGPGGARKVLRQASVDLAILETARGGLLRRGLGVERADAALITNIAEDHLGDFGSQNLDELLAVKWVVSRAVADDGVLILNADDERLVARSRDYASHKQWFGLEAENPVVTSHLNEGGTAFVLDGQALVQCVGGQRMPLCTVDEVPIALGGAARHNIANALAAAALTSALGVSREFITEGLRTMTQAANPGRCNIYEVSGFTVVVDFAHNPAAMHALFDLATALPARRRLLAFGQAGDRPDALIEGLARAAWEIGLDQVLVSELADYHRGREHGEVFGVIHEELVRCGAGDDQIHHFEEETEALEFALDWAQPGDLVIMLALGRAPEIHERLTVLSDRADG